MRNLNLNLGHNKLTTGHILSLEAALQNRNLQSFHLGLSGARLTRKNMVHLLDWLGENIYVEDGLGLDLSSVYQEQAQYDMLLEMIKKFESLRYLHINLEE